MIFLASALFFAKIALNLLDFKDFKTLLILSFSCISCFLLPQPLDARVGVKHYIGYPRIS
jgi:hypothetical protein